MQIERKINLTPEIVIEPKEVEELRAKLFIPFDVGKVKKANFKLCNNIKLEYITEADRWLINVINTESENNKIISFGLRKNGFGKIEAFVNEKIELISDKLDNYFKPLKPFPIAYYSQRVGVVGDTTKEVTMAEMILNSDGPESLKKEMQKLKDQDNFQQNILENKADLVEVVNLFRNKVGILNPKIHVDHAEIHLKNKDILSYYGGNYFNSDYWCLYLHQLRNNGSMISFGYQLVKYPVTLFGARDSYIEPDVSIWSVNSDREEGVQVIPKIDKQLNEAFNYIEI